MFVNEKNERKNKFYFPFLLLAFLLSFSGCGNSEFVCPDGETEDLTEQEIQKILTRGAFETDAFITEWVVPAQETISLPLDSNYNYNCLVDWGDGSANSLITTYNHPGASHTYMKAGTYQIRILGTCEAWSWPNTGMECRKYLTKVLQWGNVSFVSLASAFQNCSSLVSIVAGIPDVKNFDATFRNCVSLAELPVGLFEKCHNTTSFYSTFMGCSMLRTLPAGLFDECYNAKTISATFNGTGLLFLPEGLFKNCTNVTNFMNVFTSCEKLTAIPDDLFNNCPNVVNVGFAFYKCKNLKSIPLGLFDNCKKIFNFGGVFYDCTALTGITPKTDGLELWERAGKIGYPATVGGAACFRNCTNLSNYSSIPTGWK